MFHVEQTIPVNGVEYRLRWPGSAHDSLCDWGVPRSISNLPYVFSLTDPSVEVQGQWRIEGEEGWEDCQAMEFGGGSAAFEIEFLEDRPATAERELDAMGMNGDFPAVFRITLPDGAAWNAGDKISIDGESSQHGPGQYFQPGAFVSESSRLRITGTDSSQVALLSVESAVPGLSTHPQRAFMIRTGTLPPEEKENFINQPEVSQNG